MAGRRLGGVSRHHDVDGLVDVDGGIAGVGRAQRLAAQPRPRRVVRLERLADERLGGRQIAQEPCAPGLLLEDHRPGVARVQLRGQRGDARRQRANRVAIALGPDRREQIAQHDELVPARSAGVDDGERLLLQRPGPRVVSELRQIGAELRRDRRPHVALLGRQPRQRRLQQVARGGVVAEAVQVPRHVEIEHEAIGELRGQLGGAPERHDRLLAVPGRAVDAAERAQQAGAPARVRPGRVGDDDRFVDGVQRLVEAAHADRVIGDALERCHQRVGIAKVAEGRHGLAGVAQAELGVAEVGGDVRQLALDPSAQARCQGAGTGVGTFAGRHRVLRLAGLALRHRQPHLGAGPIGLLAERLERARRRRRRIVARRGDGWRAAAGPGRGGRASVLRDPAGRDAARDRAPRRARAPGRPPPRVSRRASRWPPR